MKTKKQYIFAPKSLWLATIINNRGGFGCVVNITDEIQRRPHVIVEVVDKFNNYYGNVRRSDLIPLPLTKKTKLELLIRAKNLLAAQKSMTSEKIAEKSEV